MSDCAREARPRSLQAPTVTECARCAVRGVWFARCPICLELLRCPAQLHCGHYFCARCTLEVSQQQPRAAINTSTECAMHHHTCRAHVTGWRHGLSWHGDAPSQVARVDGRCPMCREENAIVQMRRRWSLELVLSHAFPDGLPPSPAASPPPTTSPPAAGAGALPVWTDPAVIADPAAVLARNLARQAAREAAANRLQGWSLRRWLPRRRPPPPARTAAPAGLEMTTGVARQSSGGASIEGLSELLNPLADQ